MKYLFYILLSLSLTALSPVVAGEKKSSGEGLSKGAESVSNESSEEVMEENSDSMSEAAEGDSLESGYSCQGPAVMEMPAVGLYAPLLEPMQKPKMSKAKAKAKKQKKKEKSSSTAREALKP